MSDEVAAKQKGRQQQRHTVALESLVAMHEAHVRRCGSRGRGRRRRSVELGWNMRALTRFAAEDKHLSTGLRMRWRRRGISPPEHKKATNKEKKKKKVSQHRQQFARIEECDVEPKELLHTAHEAVKTTLWHSHRSGMRRKALLIVVVMVRMVPVGIVAHIC